MQKRLDLLEEVVCSVVRWQPDIVGFSCMTHNYRWCVRVAEGVRRRRKLFPIIFGGIHPTSAPEEVIANDCVDMVAVGEAEVSLLQLLEAMRSGRPASDIPGIWLKADGKIVRNEPRAPVENLDLLPLPDKRLFQEKVPALRRDDYSILTSRGCPFACTFCCNDVLRRLYRGRKLVRRRSVDSVISELRSAKLKLGFTRVAFQDEVFTSDLRWLREFSRPYRNEVGLPFRAFSHFKFASEQHVRLLKEAGCWKLDFGLQSASERIRREVCNRHHSNAEAAAAIRRCKAHGILVQCDHILGLPFETDAELAEGLKFYREALPDVVYTYWLTYYPGTSIIQKGREAGLLTDTDIERIHDGRPSFYHEGTVLRDRNRLATHQMLLDLLPFLPAGLHRRLERNEALLRLLPKGYLPHFLLLALGQLKLGRMPFLRKVRLALSKKHVP